ncbi:MAG: bifunctional diaminohydroxyphosphoribosylaminopyrimidine deaminase/5-amino-6-(5-phosphoribosylamino)uracil reductase RibD [Bacteroidetes bacterium]|nr:bifunctional diaminohydroxyphosphoribosylaminopyrimidine deaminase/5-amino-6-(5-phosphoribosylamino)uracil reductase RibD [Bacteroidota bacterium]
MHEKKDSLYMQKSLQLAERGRGNVEPNPMVGAVVVSGGRIVGKGWHRMYGEPHAEVEALSDAGVQARGATLYVSLEPCNHYGKTPPCTQAIIDAGIRKVVIGMPDPNPDVAGRGAKRLRDAGLTVVEDVERARCEALNEVFIVNVTEKRPFILLKIAQTLDGYIAAQKGTSHWITSEESRVEVHRLRSLYDAVLVGAETVRKDNPSLTVRHVDGRQPQRILLTRSWNVSPAAAIFRDGGEDRTIVVTSKKSARTHAEFIGKLRKRGIRVIEVTTDTLEYASLKSALQVLFEEHSIRSILVEGGAEVFSAFVRARIADRIDIFTAPKIIGQGRGAFSGLRPLHLTDAYRYRVEDVLRMGSDVYTILRPDKED